MLDTGSNPDANDGFAAAGAAAAVGEAGADGRGVARPGSETGEDNSFGVVNTTASGLGTGDDASPTADCPTIIGANTGLTTEGTASEAMATSGASSTKHKPTIDNERTGTNRIATPKGSARIPDNTRSPPAIVADCTHRARKPANQASNG